LPQSIRQTKDKEYIMLIYLIQHADALSEEKDPARPLSEAGIQDISKVAAYLSRLDVRVNQILYSKKLRAKQTAEVIAKNLTLNNYKELAESDGLLPLDGPSAWDDRLKYFVDDLMLVGHMPHLGKLASLLLCGDAERNIISFQTACVVCLERDEKAIWSLRWMTTPGIII
jgi:phosphohistidine phosphatase